MANCVGVRRLDIVLSDRLSWGIIDGYSSIEIFSPDGKRVEGIEIEGSVDTIILANDGVIYALSSKWTRDLMPEWELYLIRSVE